MRKDWRKMLETANTAVGQLRVLNSPHGCRNPAWSGALARFFELARGILRYVTADLASGRLGERSFLAGRAEQLGIRRSDLDDILSNYPIQLDSPFEETASIAGGLWSGRSLFGPIYDDALAKLKFSVGTLDLPMHTHDHSDRFITVAAGSGRFWWCEAAREEFQGCGVESMPVREGDVLFFTRGLLHTFSAPDDDLLLLSYHSPEIAFTDSRQYTLPSVCWTPRMHVEVRT
jgi:mannose-6-phosphate isomerase-like protein (cupin superfamily)